MNYIGLYCPKSEGWDTQIDLGFSDHTYLEEAFFLIVKQ